MLIAELREGARQARAMSDNSVEPGEKLLFAKIAAKWEMQADKVEVALAAASKQAGKSRKTMDE